MEVSTQTEHIINISSNKLRNKTKNTKEYFREWKSKNPEYFKQYFKLYKLKHPEKFKYKPLRYLDSSKKLMCIDCGKFYTFPYINSHKCKNNTSYTETTNDIITDTDITDITDILDDLSDITISL